MNSGKPWAYAGAVTGGVVSVAANVAHSFRPPDGQPANWQPQVGAVLLAAFWPCALLLAVELLARVAWPRQLRWTLARWGGVTPVALVAAIVSYRHLSGLLDWYGEDGITVTIGPAAVDGLMVISTAALLALAGGRVAIRPPIPADPPEWASEPVDPSDPSERASEPVDPSTHPSEVVAEWVNAAAIRDGLGPPPVLRSVPQPSGRKTTPAATVARADDLARAREAMRDGRLSRPLTADTVRRELRIGLANARAVRDALNAEPERSQNEA